MTTRTTRPQERWEPTAAMRAAVYVAINEVTCELYVGYTARSLRQRIHAHFNAAVCGRKTRFCNAIRKYGRHSFVFWVAAECQSKDAALACERRLIEVLKPEYNLTAGGEGAHGLTHSEASKAKMKAWRAAHPDHKPRQGKPAPGSGLLGHRTKLARGTVARSTLGVRMSDETKEKISATKKARRLKSTTSQLAGLGLGSAASKPSVSKPVICIDDGKTYPSAAAAAAAYGLNRRSVASVASPSRPQMSVHGHRFEYAGA